MLFMVIESFKSGDARPVGERFRRRGRMMPQGLTWVDVAGKRCFQIMEAADEAALREWIANWSDLVDFEVVPVMTSVQFWAETELGGAA
jgi:hypothetical protein